MTAARREIELLSPARDAECGRAAVDHGADAVYIGAPRFGARAAAGNSVADIAALADYAHLYHVRVYAALNTILRDDELDEARALARELYGAGVDALIVQDMGLRGPDMPPLPLHASTQTDNRTAGKVRFLADAGFRRVVLARELSLEEIAAIGRACPDVELEVFVHGALCVSYSGQCYASQACFGRSANRGECAQFCRLPFDLVDAGGRPVVRSRHLLSLKDLNRSDDLEALLDAGVTSLKIEGRLKDAAYVKNVTAYYREKLDAVLRRRTEYARASSGRVTGLAFRPQPEKSFSRGFTRYFLRGREAGVSSPGTPKSLGEEMGAVREVRGDSLTVSGVKAFGNGDGACYLDEAGRLQGFRVNRAEGDRLFPAEMPRVRPGTTLFRNYDAAFDRLTRRGTARRRIGVRLRLDENAFGFTLTLADEDGFRASVTLAAGKRPARTPQAEQVRAQLSRLGDTPFEPAAVELGWSAEWFLPASRLADLRRRGTEALLRARRAGMRRPAGRPRDWLPACPEAEVTYLGNVMNAGAAAFYREHGARRVDAAYEARPVEGAAVMRCRYCLRFEMGWCPARHGGRPPFEEPFFLRGADGRRFRLEFDCKRCEMLVYAAE